MVILYLPTGHVESTDRVQKYFSDAERWISIGIVGDRPTALAALGTVFDQPGKWRIVRHNQDGNLDLIAS